MANPKSKLNDLIRDENPCNGCNRPWKKPGCHDHCDEHKKWKCEVERIKIARKEYEISRGYR